MRQCAFACTIAAVVGGLLLGAPATLAAQGVAEAAATDSAAARPSRASGAEAVPSTAPRAIRSFDRAEIESRWGIAIESLELTAAGYMLDFRFKIVDPAKAAPLFDRKTRPTLKDEKTGAVMLVPVPPKVGALRPANDPKEGRTYFMFFGNPGGFIKRFSKVTVTVGEFSVSGLVVR
jgi:hypothetical protein